MRSLVVLLSLFAAAPAFSQVQQYRLERIVVAGPIEAEDIVRAEARLEEEKMYTAEDFRQAVYRVRRLPFIADAAWRIEPGLTAGSSTLVIQIATSTVFFYETDARFKSTGSGVESDDGSASIGSRFLLGELGTFDVALGDRGDDNDLGALFTYRAYDILGRGGFGVISAGQRFGDPRRYDPDLDLLVGWPLTRKQSVIGTVARRKSRVAFEDEENEVTLTDRDIEQRASLRWLYESNDDPLFTRRGVSLSAGPIWSRTITIREEFDEDEDDDVAGTETWSERYGFAVNFAAARPLSTHTAGFLRLRGEDTRMEGLRQYEGDALVGIAYDFHDPDVETLHDIRMRIELGAGYRFAGDQPNELEDFRSGAIAEAAFVLRNRWGSVRVTASYSARD